MSIHTYVLGRVGQPLRGQWPAAPLEGALTAAGYPLPVRVDGEIVGRLFNLREEDGDILAVVQWYGEAPAEQIELAPVLAEAKLYAHDGMLTLEDGTVVSLIAAPMSPAQAAQAGDWQNESDVSDGTSADSSSGDGTITVNTDLPVAPMDTPYDAHTAVTRVATFAGANAEVLGDAFLYQDPGTDGNSVDDYQFPVADIIDGAMVLVPQAVADAATIIDSGDATGDLSEADMNALSDVLDELYAKVAGANPDATPPAESTASMDTGCTDCGMAAAAKLAADATFAVTAAATADLPIAADDTSWDGSAAESRVLKWATGPDGDVDGGKLGSAYLFQTPGSDATKQSSYKLPVADVIAGKLQIVPNAVRAASAALGGARGGVKGMTPAQRKTAQAAASALMGRIRSARKTPVAAAANPVTAAATGSRYVRHLNPPDGFFAPLQLSGPTPITVTADGEVYGHVADWRQCHTSFTAAGICIEVPRSRCDYCKYHSGSVVTASGAQLRAGSLCVGGGHAPVHGPGAEIAAATAHYDKASAVAKGVMREDEWGPYFHGALTPTATDEEVYAVMAYPPSGDWRPVSPRGPLEMIAVTAVATPGYPVSSVTASADGDITAAIVTRNAPYAAEMSTERGSVDNLDVELLALRAAAIDAIAASIGRTRNDELAALSAAVHG